MKPFHPRWQPLRGHLDPETSSEKFGWTRIGERFTLRVYAARLPRLASPNTTENAKSTNSKARQWRAVMPVETGEIRVLSQDRISPKSDPESSGKKDLSATGCFAPIFRPSGRVPMNLKGTLMFNHPSNSRANRFNGRIPVFNRFAGAKVIGKGPKWRKGSRFDCDGSWRRPLDRNDRARVLCCAEALERRTKRKHKRDGVLGQAALAVLRCLLNYFQNQHSGRLDPSYRQIQGQTGFCRQTIANAIKNLELAGILEIMRRIVRERVRVWVEETQQFFAYDRVVQTTNAYMVNFPLPARQKYGDLGAPLLRPEKYRPSKSRFSTEPTGDIIPRKEKPLDPALENALNSLEKSLN